MNFATDISTADVIFFGVIFICLVIAACVENKCGTNITNEDT